MTHIILITSMAAFVAYFFAIGFPWLSVGPIIIMFFFTTNSLVNIKTEHFNFKEFIETNSLYLSWILILLGISGLFFFLKVDVLYIAIYMMAINLFLWIGSFITGYRDGKGLFHVMYYLSFLGFIAALGQSFDIETVYKVIGYSLPFNFLVYLFVSIVIGRFFVVEDKIGGLAYAFGHLTILRGAIILIGKVELIHLILAQVYLTVIYTSTNQIVHSRKPQKITPKAIDARDILAGKKVLDYRRNNEIINRKNMFTTEKVQLFLENLDPRISLFINSYNIALIIVIIGYYMIEFQGGAPLFGEQLLFWLSILLFFINFLISQKEYTLPKRQRIFVFVIINFAIYSNIIYISDSQPTTVATLGIVWNIINSLLILYSKNLISENLIKYHDYRYWITVNMLVVPINLFYMAQIDVDGSLLFALISTYIGIQGFLLFYNIKYIRE